MEIKPLNKAQLKLIDDYGEIVAPLRFGERGGRMPTDDEFDKICSIVDTMKAKGMSYRYMKAYVRRMIRNSFLLYGNSDSSWFVEVMIHTFATMIMANDSLYMLAQPCSNFKLRRVKRLVHKNIELLHMLDKLISINNVFPDFI